MNAREIANRTAAEAPEEPMPIANESLVLALPKGRILKEVMPVVRRGGIRRFATNVDGLDIIRVRSFDVATFVAFGAAHFGVAGNDVLMEFDYPEIYAPVDLGVGRCRLVVAEPKDMVSTDDPGTWSNVRIATKYPTLTSQHFARRGVQAECIKLNGALELAPRLGLCRRIVDLVATGRTLKANGLVEVERIAEITSRLAVNRAAWKTRPDEIGKWIEKFREAVNGNAA
jgi:ATP phosphoribosyltransferase